MSAPRARGRSGRSGTCRHWRRTGSCFRAVVDDVAETRTTHALPALAQRKPERLRANMRRCSSNSGWPTRTSGPATTNFTSPTDFRNYHERTGRESCRGRQPVPGPHSSFSRSASSFRDEAITRRVSSTIRFTDSRCSAVNVGSSSSNWVSANNAASGLFISCCTRPTAFDSSPTFFDSLTAEAPARIRSRRRLSRTTHSGGGQAWLTSRGRHA